jgi:hypothetical protein
MSEYPVGLVGESNYQPAILACRTGQRVEVLHEIGNPYDKKAIVVRTEDGQRIGYIGKDCWLRGAIHDEGQCCEAIIFSLHPGEHGAGVVLNVQLKRGEIGKCNFSR